MIPTIDMKATGIRLKRIMKMYGFSVKDVQQYLDSEVFRAFTTG